MIWRCRDRRFDLDERALVMGVLNVTPDSFSDGGRYLDPEDAVSHGRELVAEGADLVDVGAESTRPGSSPVPPAEQIARLTPVIAPLVRAGACVSVDTASAEVARAAIAWGAVVVNDVTALRDPAMGPLIAESGAGVVLMHMKGAPATMQDDPRYADVTGDVLDWFGVRLRGARRMGIAEEQIVVDPGIGFGKTAAHNRELLARLGAFAALKRPVLVGLSRKRFLSEPGELPADARLERGLAATAIAVFEGARIVRTHDVHETKRAIEIAEAIRRGR